MARYVFLLFDSEDWFTTAVAEAGASVIDAPDLDVALGLARRCPAAHVEVRPVLAVPEDC